MNLYAILEQNCFFNGSVCFFGFMHFGKRFCCFFSYEFISFFGTELFFQWVLFLLASGILEDGSVAFLWYEFISFFGTELLFQWDCLFFLASGILENGSVAFFHVNLFFLKHLASGILVGTFLCFFIWIEKTFLTALFFNESVCFCSGRYQIFQFLWSRKNKYIEYCPRPSLKFKLKKYWKIDFCSFWQDLGFGECFFLFKF